MKFLVDAQLSQRLSHRLQALGHKDADFVDSLIVQGVPHKLLLISTGNIRNSELEHLFFEILRRWSQGLRHTNSLRSIA